MATLFRKSPPAELLRPLAGDPSDYDALIADIGEARFVLIGEASHGTHEFYRERAAITRRLIVEKGFSAVAAEADWPDAFRVNRFVRGRGGDRRPSEALSGFQRFPAWMWRNTDVLDFVGWLRLHNADRPEEQRVGFYGLDIYSLHASIAAVLEHLERVDPDAARRARARYSCFDHFGDDPQTYGYLTTLSVSRSCEDAVVSQLGEMVGRAASDAEHAPEAVFDAVHNARIVRNAEQYYRSMFGRRAESWNLRDRHMMETLTGLAAHLAQPRQPAKIVVWAHNSHLGDARATEMSLRGELNLGQLVREQHADECYNIGFSTHSGTVTAADDWGAPAQTKRVQPGLPGSYEALFHEAGASDFMVLLREAGVRRWLEKPRLQRAIGVIYRPQTERASHYYEAHLAEQFDAMLHFDTTRAVQPLADAVQTADQDEPETYPSGI